MGLPHELDTVKLKRIDEALAAHHGIVKYAAEALGVRRVTLISWMHRFQIHRTDYFGGQLQFPERELTTSPAEEVARCAICHRSSAGDLPLSIYVRFAGGRQDVILCKLCTMGLSCFMDDSKLLRRAIYLLGDVRVEQRAEARLFAEEKLPPELQQSWAPPQLTDKTDD